MRTQSVFVQVLAALVVVLVVVGVGALWVHHQHAQQAQTCAEQSDVNETLRSVGIDPLSDC